MPYALYGHFELADGKKRDVIMLCFFLDEIRQDIEDAVRRMKPM